MSEISPAATGAQPEVSQEDPFAGFSSEAFSGGELIEDAAAGTGTESSGEENTPATTAEEATPALAETGTPKKAQTAQERINELTRARREAEREAALLRERLDQLEARVTPPTPATPGKKPESSEKSGGPRPEDFEFGELDSQYIAAVVEYQAEQHFARLRAALVQEQEQSEHHRAARTKFQKQVEQGRQKYEDFEDVVVKGAQEGAWPLSETLGMLLVESEVGDDIAYHLASHPDEAMSVDRLTPVEQARYFGKLEATFSAARAAAPGGESSAEKSATTRAPRAPAPVTTAKGAGGRFQTSASTDDFAAFEEAVAKAN